jgi:hypothetical protein
LSPWTSAIVLILQDPLERWPSLPLRWATPASPDRAGNEALDSYLTEGDVRRLKPHAIRRLIVGFELAIPLSLYAFEVVVGLAVYLRGIPAEHIARARLGRDHGLRRFPIPGFGFEMRVRRATRPRGARPRALPHRPPRPRCETGTGQSVLSEGLADQVEQLIRHHAVAVEQVLDTHLVCTPNALAIFARLFHAAW